MYIDQLNGGQVSKWRNSQVSTRLSEYLLTTLEGTPLKIFRLMKARGGQPSKNL